MLPCLPFLRSGALSLAPALGGAVPADVDYAVQAWTIRDGLPQNEVTALAQTPDGNLWIGTFGGLVRFDGLRFEVFDLARFPELGSNRVVELCATGGALYVGTEDAGLVRLVDGRFERVGDGRLSRSVWCLVEAAGGGLWVGGDEGAARVRDRRVVERLATDDVRAILESPPGTLWIATPDGLRRQRGGGARSMSDEPSIVALCALEDGTVLAGLHGSDHLLRWRGGAEEPVQLPATTRVRVLLEDATGGIWLGDEPWTLRGARFEAPLDAPALSGVRALLEDMEGNIWVGGPEGLHRLRPTPMRGFPLPPAQRAPWIVAPDRSAPEALWVALYSGRLFHFRAGAFEPVEGVDATAFAPSRQGAVWVSDRTAGIGRLRDGAFAPDVPLARLEPWEGAAALLEDRAGDLWFGDGPRLGRLRDGAIETWTTADGLPPHEILALLESSTGELWIGSRGGLARFADDRVQRTWSSGVELPLGPVRALHEDGAGRIWVGTYGGGLCRIDPDGAAHALGTEDGLHETVVSSIFADGPEHLLLLGNRALSRVSLTELCERIAGSRRAVHPRLFDQGPGIDVFEGNGGAMTAGCWSSDGRLWLPTREGLVRYDPAALAPVSVPPPVAVDEVVVGGRVLAAASVLAIPPGPRDLELRFCARTFVEPERARYLCRLEGRDEDWVDVGSRRSISYANLPPGHYRFHVRAANRDGVWSEEGASIALHLRPWLHETLWFRALAALSIAALGAGALWWRTRRIRRRAELLERQVAARTGELREARDHLEEKVAERTEQLEQALRTVRDDAARRDALEAELRESQRLEAVGRLAGGLAHDFNNMLTAVLGEADLALDALGSTPVERRQRRHLEEIKRASLRASDLTRQLLAYSRQQILQPEQLAPNATIEGLHGMLRRLVREDIALELDLRHGVGDVLVDPGQLEQVIVNLVVNASEATTAGGRITVETSPEWLGAPADAYHVDAREGAYARIAVRDTGSGIQEGLVDRVFEPFFTTKPPGVGNGLGLASVHGIVKQSGGFVRVESAPGRGTTFEVFLPAVRPAEAGASEALAPAEVERPEAATVLVCDDDGSVLRVMTFVLEAEGHRVLAADGPAAALALARAEDGAFDLLVTDMVMPGMGGRELAGRVRELRPDLEVLYVSGYSSELVDSGELDDSEDFLHKPFTPAELTRRVACLLARARAEA